ncbi:unnamed protein product [Darwinula stevensoni]|uniref:Uncharacterized protein n=1 Tax=Darwinula stevensoni TaxID=69355 RepID=A0A7R8XCS6_9CRUS|nr:unnamed protein product [Darwinula stevensoni]CAG0894002.1 unnamed protein product [Darwinula stevensoni]
MIRRCSLLTRITQGLNIYDKKLPQDRCTSLRGANSRARRHRCLSTPPCGSVSGGERLRTTQINGINNASRATHPLRKIIWWVVTVVAAGATVQGICGVITAYLQYSVSTTSSVTQPKSLTFPAVTVCNLSPFPCSKLTHLGDVADLAKVLKRADNRVPRCKSDNIQRESDDIQPTEFIPEIRRNRERRRIANVRGIAFAVPFAGSKSEPPPKVDGGEGEEVASDQTTWNSYFYALSRLSEEQKVALLQDRDDFIRGCKYEGVDCKRFFFPFANTSYGSCYAFNMKSNEDRDSEAGSRRTVLPGPYNGLELELYVNAREWPSSVLSSEGGVRVNVYQTDNLPSPEESGFDARTGTATKVALRQVEVSRLPHPYESDCYSSWDECGYHPVNSTFVTYDSLMCRRMCLQAAIVKRCSCKCPYFLDHFTFSDGKLDGIPVCDVRSLGSGDYQCLLGVFDGLKNGSTTCPCNAPCRQTQYKVTISSSEWPTATYMASPTIMMMLASLPKFRQ